MMRIIARGALRNYWETHADTLDAIFDAAPDTPEYEELDVLATLIDDYENKHDPIDEPEEERIYVSAKGSPGDEGRVSSEAQPLRLSVEVKLENAQLDFTPERGKRSEGPVHGVRGFCVPSVAPW